MFTYYILLNSRKVFHHILSNTPAENIPNGLEDLGFNVINRKQMTVSLTAPNEQRHEVPLPLFRVTLTRIIYCREH
jgi:hypothetical protein